MQGRGDPPQYTMPYTHADPSTLWTSTTTQSLVRGLRPLGTCLLVCPSVYKHRTEAYGWISFVETQPLDKRIRASNWGSSQIRGHSKRNGCLDMLCLGLTHSHFSVVCDRATLIFRSPDNQQRQHRCVCVVFAEGLEAHNCWTCHATPDGVFRGVHGSSSCRTFVLIVTLVGEAF